MTTLPASVVASLVADILYARAGRLRNRLERNPRKPAASKAEGRQRVIESLESQAKRIQALKPAGDVSAEVAGLLLAWAGGHNPAIAELESLDSRVEGLRSEDVAGACRLLFGTKGD